MTNRSARAMLAIRVALFAALSTVAYIALFQGPTWAG